MSTPNEVTVTCPQCGQTQPFITWESLNVTVDREEKQKLLKGELHRFTCNKCGCSDNVNYSMLYHDMEQKVWMWLWLDGGEPGTIGMPPAELMQGYRFRLVTSLNDLIEKIHIFDDALDDRVLELMKLLLRSQESQSGRPLTGDLFFSSAKRSADGKGSIEFEHLKSDGFDSMAVPVESYQQIAELVATKLSSTVSESIKWLRIDHTYAESLFNQLK